MIDEFFWDDLIQFIEEKTVVPIVGPELLAMEIAGRTVNFYRYLAERLADVLRIPRGNLTQDFDLPQVIYQYLLTPGAKRENLYRRLKALIGEQVWPVPKPLRKLAEIAPLELFISTTPDTLLQTALDEIRFQGQPRTVALAYNINDPEDLPEGRSGPGLPLVYHLFGRVSAQPDYALTEEDTLEFLHSLQSPAKRPALLFDVLQNYHLLMLGYSDSNWLTRFFLRTIRNKRFIVRGEREAILAGESLPLDKSLVLFINSFSSQDTRIYDQGGAVDFVDRLHRSWKERHPDTAPKPTLDPVRVLPVAPEPDQAHLDMVDGAVFLSYASQDLSMVEKLKEALDGEGLDVWFDKKQLEAGDKYEMKVMRNIRNCSLFCPIISRNTEARLEGWFRREWRAALDRARDIHDDVPFILPVVVDDTPFDAPGVPDSFHSLHWTRLEAGRPPAPFIDTLKREMRAYRRRRGPQS